MEFDPSGSTRTSVEVVEFPNLENHNYITTYVKLIVASSSNVM